MNRRDFQKLIAAASVLNLVAPSAGRAQGSGQRQRVGMLVHADMIMLDLIGPLTAFNIMQADVQLIAKTSSPVLTDVGLPISPTCNFETSPSNYDVLFVPGGLKGTLTAMKDVQTVEFVRAQGHAARFVTSVCTGSLLLGAAGLLKGYEATSHWYVRELLANMGATVRKERVVEDRNRITGGGVTAGIDLGLTIASRVTNEDTAKRIQLLIEYDPKPPFDAGSPERAGTAAVNAILARRGELIHEAELATKAAGHLIDP